MSAVKRILVVDDEESLTFGLYQNFIIADFEGEVKTAANGREAWEKFQELPFDVVITDIYMDEMNGIELLKKIKAFRPQTKVVVMTAYAKNSKETEAKENGADYFLEKPFDNRTVRRLVMRLLRE
jgi:YesN/AraC family two-component response regulator